MSAEKKLWQLPTPFRRFSAKPDLQLNAKTGPSGSHVPSVYLSDDSSTSDFIIVPEFDDPIPSQTTLESNYTSNLSKQPEAAPSSLLTPNGAHGYDPKPIAPQYASYLGGDSCDISVVHTSQNDDFTQRLDSAYAHIYSMSSVPSSRASLSSDPQILRKQLGVPQHSVLNYPNYSSPDLPNPHTSPRESPKLPLTTLPDVPHDKTSKDFGLRINTNVSSPSPRPPFSDFQPVQIESALTALTLTEPLRYSTPDAHTTDTLTPQTSIPNSSKLSKRRVTKPISSLSSPPSSNRQASRGILRKPPIGSPPLANTYRRQISLPQIRPPSPFRVDIPLHHTWHNRRTEFYSSSEYHSKISQCQETKSRRTSGSTEVLASLAWIGTPPMAPNYCFSDRIHRSASPTFFPDHFRMAIAVEDDSISDDVLVDRLEKVRRIGSPSEWGRDISSSSSSGSAYFPGVGNDENRHSYTPFSSSPPSTSNQRAKPCNILSSSLVSEDTTSDSEDAIVWQAARKAVLCIREIVRTEKKYQEALKMLLNAQTATPPPPSMTPHVSTLVRVSETLLKHFLEDPSAWGVSTAFVTSEDELEATMVSWCAVAGTFFTDGNDHDPPPTSSASKWRLRKSGMMPSPVSSAMTQTSIPLSPQLPPMFSTINTTSKIQGRSTEEYCTVRHPQNKQEKQAMPVSLRKPESIVSQAVATQPPSRKLSVRDLAIQPIQRVMRYVLLYKDLLDCTPSTSPSRVLVERALEASARIARHCDRAQRNPAFFHTS